VAHYYYAKLAAQEKPIRIKELTPPVETFPAFIGFSKANNLGALRDQVDATLKAMKADGTYQRIIAANVASWGLDIE